VVDVLKKIRYNQYIMTKDLVKQNINFLEYPLWFQNSRLAENTLSEFGQTWSDREGYIYRSGYKMPVKTDGIFLLYLLLQSQKNNFTEKITLTRYQILKDCGKGLSKVWYDRLEESLNRWLRVDISFKGTFYNGENYSSMAFHIIDSWTLDKKTKKLDIILSPRFLQMMCGKGFFKYINFTEFKKLDSPLATRLYEILSKTFYGRDIWEIDAMKLAEKIPLSLSYPSEVVVKIKPAINRINKHTDLKIALTVRHKERGKAILIFTKIPTEQPTKLPAKKPKNIVITDELTKVLQALPESKQKQKSIIEIIQKFYKEFGADYVIRNIKYARKNAKKNFRPYLLKALKADWGIVIEEDEEEKALQTQLLKIKKKKEIQQQKSNQEEEKKQAELEQKVKDHIATLSESQLEELREEAISQLDPQILDYLLSSPPKSATGISARMTLKTKMQSIVKERLSFR